MGEKVTQKEQKKRHINYQKIQNKKMNGDGNQRVCHQ